MLRTDGDETLAALEGRDIWDTERQSSEEEEEEEEEERPQGRQCSDEEEAFLK